MDESKKKQTNEEEISPENVEVKVDEEGNKEIQVDFSKMDFEKLENDEDKKNAFESMKKANIMLMEMAKEMEKNLTEFEAKASGKVSDDSYKRLLADYDNYKRRTATSRSEGFNDGQNEVLLGLFEIMDNFERALGMIHDEKVKEGVEMIYDQCGKKLDSFNVKEIKCLGETFDPEFQNAVMMGDVEDKEQVDKVIEVFQKGYMKNDKVLRHAMVKVGK